MVTKMFGVKKSLFIVLALVFVVAGNITSNLNVNDISDPAQTLTAGIDKIFALPDINEGEEMLQARCLKNGNNESFSIAMEARAKFESCVSGLVDVQTIKKEINAAKPTGDLDTVFKKYCRKTPTLKGCIKELLDGTEQCLSENEQGQMTVVQNITDSLMNFICHKEGDRIALFIAEGGPECLTSKMDPIQACVNSTMTSAQSTINKNISTEDIPEFAFDSEKCGYFTEVQKCVVQVLEDCAEPTPANIIGSLFDFVRKSTPCTQFMKTSRSSSIAFSFVSFVIPLGAIFLAKYNI